MYHNKCFLEENKLNIVFPTFKSARVLKLFYDWPGKFYFWQFMYMSIRLNDRVQFSIKMML